MPDPTPADFFEIFTEIGIIEQLSRARLEAQLPDGLIAPHFAVLNHLSRVGDGRTPMEIARAFQVPKTSMTHTLRGLEARGLVETRPNPEDGRSKCVWLTAAGRALREQIIGQLGRGFAQMAQALDMEALAGIKPVLTALRQYLDAARDG